MHQPAVVQNPDISSSLARESDADKKQKSLPFSLSGRGCCEFKLPADLLGNPPGKSSNSPAQDGGETNARWATLVCCSTVGESFLTSMNPISSQGDVRELPALPRGVWVHSSSLEGKGVHTVSSWWEERERDPLLLRKETKSQPSSLGKTGAGYPGPTEPKRDGPTLPRMDRVEVSFDSINPSSLKEMSGNLHVHLRAPPPAWLRQH